jgi:hypothetical protein
MESAMPFQYRPSFDLNQVASRMSADQRQIIEYAMLEARVSIEAFTPEDEGLMVSHLMNGSGPIATGNGWVGYYGNLKGINLGKSGTGLRTISDFMKWWRSTHTGKEKREGSWRPWYTPSLAWFYLSDEQKDELSAQRGEGRYGGPKPPPQYLGAVSGGRRPHPSGNPPNQRFIEGITRFLNERLRRLPRSIAEGTVGMPDNIWGRFSE